MDPRLGSTQTCKDGGPPAVDEWRSLAYVALATAYANFVHLVYDPEDYPDVNPNASDPLLNVFEDATPVPLIAGEPPLTKRRLISTMREAWDTMQTKLKDLQVQWTSANRSTSNDTDREPDRNIYREDVNYMYFRPLPYDIHTGPGY